MFKKFIKIQINRFVFLYYRIRNLWPIWFYILNLESRKFLRGQFLNLTSLEEKIINDLKNTGIAFTNISEFFPSTDFLKLQEIVAEKMLQAQTKDQKVENNNSIKKGKGYGKDFMLYLWGGGGTNPLLEVDNEFIKLALSRQVLNIACSYMNLAVKFQGFSLQSTLLVPAIASEKLSQRWHRDPDDKKILKMFIYLNDVFEVGTGPFMYVKETQLGGKFRNVFPQRPPAGVYPPIGEVEKVIPRENLLTCLGRAGTIIFADTSGLHKGGYSTKERRIMFASGYKSKASPQPINYSRPREEDTSNLSSLAKYAVRP